MKNARLRREQKDYPHSTEVASPPSPLSPSQTLSTSTPSTGSRWGKFFLDISIIQALLQRLTGSSGQQSALRDLLFACCAGITERVFSFPNLFERRDIISVKNIRNMRALIFPRLHQCPAHEPTVGGQPTPQNGWSGPSGAQVVNQTCHKINPHAH